MMTGTTGYDAPLPRLADYEPAARQRIPHAVWDFLAGGSGTESMVDANRAVLDRIMLRPRVLTGVRTADPRTTLFGQSVAAPLGVAPMAHHQLVHPDGEVATARAAGAAGAVFTASIFANRTLEDIAAAATGPLWLQLYWLRQREQMERLIDRAERAGFGALVLTVDAPVVARRPRDIRNGFAVPANVRAVNCDDALMAETHSATAGRSAVAAHSAQQFQQGLSWRDVTWLRARTRLPLLLKGVLAVEDARLAVEHGIDGVVVSNHGGRQLDGAVPAVSALPEIAAAVGARCSVLVDGAFRCGADVLKAVALGADGVLIGRPVLWGLSCGGDTGVRDVLDVLRVELAEAMLLSGCPDLDSAGPALLADDRDPVAGLIGGIDSTRPDRPVGVGAGR